MKHFHWFTQHPGISKEAFGSMLLTQRSFLPPNNNLPDSYEAALHAIEPYLVDTIVYDVCTNDCVVFRKEYAESTQCPKCGSDRYISPQSQVAVRKFTYLPLKPRLARLFGTASTAALLQAHAQTSVERNGKIFDIQQSRAWDAAYGHGGVFGEDPRGISLAMCTDGVNPWAHNKVTYSMWPIMLTLLNLPRHLRNRFSSILLVGIIPGNGTKEAHNLNPYIDIMVDELLELSCSTLFDAYRNAPFECKVSILLYILDYPGIGKVMSVVGSGGYQGCAFCELKGQHNSTLCKMVYLQNRRFLPADSVMRKDNKWYISQYNYL